MADRKTHRALSVERTGHSDLDSLSLKTTLDPSKARVRGISSDLVREANLEEGSSFLPLGSPFFASRDLCEPARRAVERGDEESRWEIAGYRSTVRGGLACLAMD